MIQYHFTQIYENFTFHVKQIIQEHKIFIIRIAIRFNKFTVIQSGNEFVKLL